MPTSKYTEPVNNASPNLPQSPQKSTDAPPTQVQLRSTSKKQRSDDKVSLLSGATGTIVLATCYLTFLCANYLNNQI